MSVSLEITDLLSLNDIQKIQDSFADLIKFTMIIMDRDGCQITRASNWKGFCEFFYSSEMWSCDCHFERLQMLAQSQRTLRTALTVCPHTGFSAAVIPISYGGEYIAGWGIGQVRIAELVHWPRILDRAADLSKKMNVPVRSVLEFIDGLPIMSMADFERMSTFIQTFSEALLRLAQSGGDRPSVNDEPATPAVCEAEAKRPVKVYAASRKPFDLRGKCLSTMLYGHDTDIAINDVLETIGRSFRASRAFVFVRVDGPVYSNRYEWCQSGVEPHKQMLINVNIRRTARSVFEYFRRDGMIVASDILKLPFDLYRILSDLSIKSTALFPMWDSGGLLGFVGVDDSREREWAAEEITILWNVSMIVADRIKKEDVTQAPVKPKHPILDMFIHTMDRIIKRIN